MCLCVYGSHRYSIAPSHTPTYTHTHIYTYIYVCVCVYDIIKYKTNLPAPPPPNNKQTHIYIPTAPAHPHLPRPARAGLHGNAQGDAGTHMCGCLFIILIYICGMQVQARVCVFDCMVDGLVRWGHKIYPPTPPHLSTHTIPRGISRRWWGSKARRRPPPSARVRSKASVG